MFSSVVHAVLAQQPGVGPAPVADGELQSLKDIAGWALQIGLWASVAAILYGAATWGIGQLSPTSQGQSRGKVYVYCGATGAVVVGLVVAAVDGFTGQVLL